MTTWARPAFAALFLVAALAALPAGATVSSFYDLETNTLFGKPANLGVYRGKVTLVVNVADAPELRRAPTRALAAN